MRAIAIKGVEKRIFLIRGQSVMLDSHLAEFYGVATGNLNRAVHRNRERFPSDFMFRLTSEEYAALRCQSGILERGHHSKYLPYVFTEQGVAMLSGVLRSRHAIRVNVGIMRAFVKLRRMIADNAELARRLNELEARYDAQFKDVFADIRELMAPPARPRKSIGFKAD